MKQKRALVTGATGFVGSHLVKHLLAEGWAVHVIVRPGSSRGQLAPLLSGLVVHSFDGNIDLMRSIVRESQPDVVFHLASLFLAEHQPEDIQRLIESNLLFGTQLVEAMSLEGVYCLVNTGTSWQHYENSGYSPVNLYAATKQAFETLLQYYVEARDLRVITLKLFDTYGAGDARKKLFNLLHRLATESHTLEMSPGDQQIDLVHVEDVSCAMTMAASRLLAGTVKSHERFAVSSGQPISLKALVNQVELALMQELPIIWGGRPYREREVMTPWTKFSTLPDWSPTATMNSPFANLLTESVKNTSDSR